MSLWAFRFLLWYVCILMVQPQNRFPVFYSLHIADLSVLAAVGLHIFSAASEKRPPIRFGPGTIVALLLMIASFVSLHSGVYQTSSVWNDYIDMVMKNALVLVLIEAMAFSVKRVWAVQATMMVASLWWVKAGIRLSMVGATYSGDRLMGPAVGLVENPNSFAYMMCLMIPLYLYFYQQTKHKLLRWGYLALALLSVFIVFRTGSRTGILILISIAAFLLPKYGSQYKLAVIIATGVIVFILPMMGALNVARYRTIAISIRSFLGMEVRRSQVVEDQQSIQSALERSAKNRDTWKLIKDHPWFGVGIYANQGLYVHRYPSAVGQVHCEILMAGRQMGVIGMSIYVALLWVLFWSGHRVQRKTRRWWPEVADLGWTFKMQTAVFIVGGAFSPLPWNAPELILVGCASGLRTHLKKLAQGQAAAIEIEAAASRSAGAVQGVTA
jgi:ElaB/YqjD/DUF883 family membrane-anchored ribosome-binding protein